MPHTIEEMEENMKKYGIKVKEECIYTAWYLYNMTFADYRKSLPTLDTKCLFVDETINDPDCDTTAVLACYRAKMDVCGKPIHWERFIWPFCRHQQIGLYWELQSLDSEGKDWIEVWILQQSKIQSLLKFGLKCPSLYFGRIQSNQNFAWRCRNFRQFAFRWRKNVFSRKWKIFEEVKCYFKEVASKLRYFGLAQNGSK